MLVATACSTLSPRSDAQQVQMNVRAVPLSMSALHAVHRALANAPAGARLCSREQHPFERAGGYFNFGNR